MADTLRIIGISGTNGSGKDAVGTILSQHQGFLFISVTDLLRAEALKRGLPAEREVLRSISAEWRRQSGLGVLVDQAVNQYGENDESHKGLAIASLRNPGEATRIHELGGVVVWMDADPRVRYDRIQMNAASRNRKEEDEKTFEQFLAEEQAEMYSDGDAATLHMAEVKKLSDVFIENNSHDLRTLESAVQAQLNLS